MRATPAGRRGQKQIHVAQRNALEIAFLTEQEKQAIVKT